MERMDGALPCLEDLSDGPGGVLYDDGTERTSSKIFYKCVKRGIDLVLSAAALAVCGLIFLVVAILVSLEDGGPVFYVSQRVGLNGKTIGVLKFRTMRPGAHCLEKMLTQEELREYRKEYKLRSDPRVTRVGSVLRKTSLDELPQLLNILKGDMSMVGPRPLLREELERKYLPAQQARLLSVRPGLTGFWQVSGRNDCTYESGKRQKTELSYVRNCGFRMDAAILIRTAWVVARRIGAR